MTQIYFLRLRAALLVIGVIFFVQLFVVTLHLPVLPVNDDARLVSSDPLAKPAVAKAVAAAGETTKSRRDEQSVVVNSAVVSAPPAKQSAGEKQKSKREQSGQKEQWDPQKMLLAAGGASKVPLKITAPIFVASLPKSGTTSVWQYFSCGGVKSSHQWIKVPPKGASNQTTTGESAERSGKCIQRNVAVDNPPFEGCGEYDVYADTGFVTIDKQTLKPQCYYPSVDGLEAMYRHYPNATIVHAIRDADAWYTSMAKWGDGSLLKRWRRCNATGFPRGKRRTPLEPSKIKQFYAWHTAHIQRFAREHPSLTYIEVQLESHETGRLLERETGIPAKCWGKCSPTSKFCKTVT